MWVGGVRRLDLVAVHERDDRRPGRRPVRRRRVEDDQRLLVGVRAVGVPPRPVERPARERRRPRVRAASASQVARGRSRRTDARTAIERGGRQAASRGGRRGLGGPRRTGGLHLDGGAGHGPEDSTGPGRVVAAGNASCTAGAAATTMRREPERRTQIRADRVGDRRDEPDQRRPTVASGTSDGPPAAAVEQPGDRQQQQHRVVVPQDRREELAGDHGGEVADAAAGAGTPTGDDHQRRRRPSRPAGWRVAASRRGPELVGDRARREVVRAS